jgi:hypothetical protein
MNFFTRTSVLEAGGDPAQHVAQQHTIPVVKPNRLCMMASRDLPIVALWFTKGMAWL